MWDRVPYFSALVKDCCNFEVLNRGVENIKEEEALVVRVCCWFIFRSI